MRIYIAGPMRGHQLYNYPAFDAARDSINAAGHVAISPTDLDRADGFDPLRLPDDHDWSSMPDDLPLRRTFVRNLEAISRCDAIRLLPGWEGSRGSRMELKFAEFLGLHVFYPQRRS